MSRDYFAYSGKLDHADRKSIVGSIRMTDLDVCLSSAGMKNIVINQIQENFEFVVGISGYKSPYIIAEFVSRRVSLSHFVDPYIAEYVYSPSEFKLFMSLDSVSTIPVSKAHLGFFLFLSKEFGNSNLYVSLLEHFDRDFICSQIYDSATLDLFFDSDDLIGRISSNFSQLTSSELDGISVSVLFHILSHHLLMISSEDDPFWYIGSHLCSDPECLDFLQFVSFEYLSSDCLCCFLSALPYSIDHRLWQSISHCEIHSD
jgi:hypothetical protein